MQFFYEPFSLVNLCIRMVIMLDIPEGNIPVDIVEKMQDFKLLNVNPQ